VNPGTKDEAEWPSKVSGRKVTVGDVIRVCGPASAGYGNPLERDPKSVLADVIDGIFNDAQAQADYGVVIAGSKIDFVATATLRKERSR
jgi:N-methylhydantoinase B/oxoprolinase/acetone carboxylase alpha subunit